MATDYLDHFIPSMISWKFDKKASASPKYAKLYDFVTSLIGDFLMDKSVKSFNNELAGTFPEPLLQEMQGIVDGAKAANPATVVSMDRLITLNYGMDFLSTQVFGGGLLGHLKDYIRTATGGKLLQEADDDMVELLELLEADFFTVPAFCDAFVGASLCGACSVLRWTQAHTLTHSLTHLGVAASHWRFARAVVWPCVRPVVPAAHGWVLPGLPDHVHLHAV